MRCNQEKLNRPLDKNRHTANLKFVHINVFFGLLSSPPVIVHYANTTVAEKQNEACETQN